MSRASNQDLKRLLSAFENLHSDVSAETLPTRAVSAVADLISAEIIAFDGFDLQGRYAGFSWHNPENAVTGDEMQVFAQFIGEHPLFVEVIEKRRFDAMKITDFLSVGQFRDTAIYNEFYRRVGVNRQMTIALPISSELMLLCALSRAEKDFSERDRDLLNLAAPHLANAFRQTQAFQRLEKNEAILQTAVGALAQGVIVLDADGQTQFVSESAAKFLERYFAGEKRSDGSLPEILRDWSARSTLAAEFDLPSSPLTIEQADGSLEIQLMPKGATRETILLLEEKTKSTPARFKSLGLTKRETEILFWLTQGKTDGVIARLCGISQRTVQKHAEHIFIKLGVETRTAAVFKALEIL